MSSLYPLPRLAVVELTYCCNHRCLFCSCPWECDVEGFPHYERSAEMSIAQWKEALDILAENGVEHVSISGGEALLKEGLLDLLDYIRTKNVLNRNAETVLISNGLAMNETFLAAFKKYRVHLSLSLPGLSTFAAHTGVDNADGVLYWMHRAHEVGLATTANVTVTRLNYGELYETIANALIAGADTLLLNRFLVGGRGVRYREALSLTREELNGMLNTAEEVLQKANRIGSLGTEIPLCAITRGEQAYTRLSIGYQCAAGSGFFVVDPSGAVRVCNHSPRKVGHIFSTPILTDVAGWQTFATRDYQPAACRRCRNASRCDCGCREMASIVSGDVRGEDALAVPPL